MHAPQASPKIEALREERPPTTTQAASILRLPCMLIQVAWTAQTIAMRPVETTTFASKLISVIKPLTSLLFSPIVGVVSDHCMHQWGRRRPFLLFATVALVVVLFLSCFMADIGKAFDGRLSGDDWQATGVSFVAVVFFLAQCLAITAMETPVLLLVADLAGDHQVTGAALGQGWSTLGNIFAWTYFEKFPESTEGVFVAVCVVLILVIAGVVFCCVQDSPRDPSEARGGGVVTTITGSLGSLPTMLIVYGIISVLMSYGVSNYTSNQYKFYESRVLDNSYDENLNWSMFDFNYFMTQDVAAYIFTWLLPLLTNQIGANHDLTISLGSHALLIIMAFARSKTLVGLIDSLFIVFRGTLSVLTVPAIVHVYGTKDIGAYVGALTAICGLGSLLSIIIGDRITETDLAYQLPVLVAGIVAAMCVFISAFLLQLKLKSL